MSEDSFSKIPTKLFNANLSSLQFRFLCNFIRISGINNGHSFFGYPNLAQINQCGRSAAIRTVKELEQLGFIEVVDRGNRSRSNDILLTLEKGFLRSQNGGFETSKQGYLNDTPNTDGGYLNDTREYLNDTREYLKDTPYKEKDLNNINLNNKTGEEYLNDTPRAEKVAAGRQKATADVAAVRSIANDEAAREVTAESQCDLEDFVLVSSFKERFLKYLPNIQLLKIGNDWAVRPYPYFQGNFDKIAGDFGAFFAEKSVHFALLKASTRRAGEIIMNI